MNDQYEDIRLCPMMDRIYVRTIYCLVVPPLESQVDHLNERITLDTDMNLFKELLTTFGGDGQGIFSQVLSYDRNGTLRREIFELVMSF